MVFSDPDVFFGPVKSARGVSTADYVRRLADENTPPTDGIAPIFEGETAEKTAIAGAGLMGRSIAAAFLRVGKPVLLYDSLPEARAAAPQRIAEELAFQRAAGENPTDEERDQAQKRVGRLLEIAEEPAALDRCGTILETIVEKLRIKQKFYQTLDAVLTGPKFLLSNTSTIQITDLAAALETTRFLRPTRFCGFHFFHPVRKRSLVEVIRGKQTQTATLAYAEQLARQIDKRPISVGDGPGFLVNRLLNPYLDESMTLLLEGVPLTRIESVCRRFGMEMGPFRIMDEIGLDVTMHSGWTFYKAFPDIITAPALLPALIDDNRLGRKNGRGFFLYNRTGNWDGDGQIDPELDTLLARVRGTRNVPEKTVLDESFAVRGEKISDTMIAARIFGGILFEAHRILRDRIVSSTEEIDRALLFALGFPASKGGIGFWADSLGPERLALLTKTLAPLSAKFRPELP